jgi:hypothetical protein
MQRFILSGGHSTKHKMYRKYFRLIFILLPLYIISCKKESTSISPNLIGTWELRMEHNGWAGFTNYPPGNGHYLKFTKSTFEIDTNRVRIDSGSYRLVKEKFYLKGEVGDRIIYNNQENYLPTFVEVLHDSLSLSEDVVDGRHALYIRIE